MLDEAISTCESIAVGLGAQNQGWEDSVAEIVEKFGEISGTFFFKTIPSIPPTRTCNRDALVVLELRRNKDWVGFDSALGHLIKSAQAVIEKAGMKGTTLT